VRHRLHELQCAPPIAHASTNCTNCLSSSLVRPARGATSPRGPSRATSSPTARGLGPGLLRPGRPLGLDAFGFRATGFGNTVGVCAARLGVTASGFEARHSDRHCPQIAAALDPQLVGRIGESCRSAALCEAQSLCFGFDWTSVEPLGSWQPFLAASAMSTRASGRLMLSGHSSNEAITVDGLSSPSIATCATSTISVNDGSAGTLARVRARLGGGEYYGDDVQKKREEIISVSLLSTYLILS
jgi:hypothetical protein